MVTHCLWTVPLARALDTKTMANMSIYNEPKLEGAERRYFCALLFWLWCGASRTSREPRTFCQKGQRFVILASRAHSQRPQLPSHPPAHPHRGGHTLDTQPVCTQGVHVRPEGTLTSLSCSGPSCLQPASLGPPCFPSVSLLSFVS